MRVAVTGVVALLNIVLAVGMCLYTVLVVPFAASIELATLTHGSLWIGGAMHFAHRRTVVPGCSWWTVVGILAATLLLAGSAHLATTLATSFLNQWTALWLQGVGLWLAGGWLFGAAFAGLRCSYTRSPDPWPNAGDRDEDLVAGRSREA